MSNIPYYSRGPLFQESVNFSTDFLMPTSAHFSILKATWLTILITLTMYCPVIVVHDSLSSLKIEDPLILLTLLVLMFKRVNSEEGFWGGKLFQKILLPYCLLIGWMFFVNTVSIISGATLASWIFTSLGIIGHFKGLALALVIFLMVRDEKTERFLIQVFIVLVLIQIIILFLQKNNLCNIHNWLTPHYRRSELGKSRFREGLRAAGSYGSPNVIGHVLGSMSGLWLAITIFKKGFFQRLAALSLCTICIIATVIFCRSRTALAAGILSCLLAQSCALIFRGKRSMFLVWSILLLIFLVVGLFNLVSSEHAERFSVFLGKESIMENESFMGRILNWKEKLSELGAGIFLGKGVIFTFGSITDNGFLTRVIRGGIIGLGLYLWLNFAIMKVLWQGIRQLGVLHPNAFILVGAISMFAATFFGNISLDPFNDNRQWATCMAIVAIGLCVRRRMDLQYNKWICSCSVSMT